MVFAWRNTDRPDIQMMPEKRLVTWRWFTVNQGAENPSFIEQLCDRSYLLRETTYSHETW